jgi:hypothetical protein
MLGGLALVVSRAKYNGMKQKKNDEIDEKDKEINTYYGLHELIMILKGIVVVLPLIALEEARGISILTLNKFHFSFT